MQSSYHRHKVAANDSPWRQEQPQVNWLAGLIPVLAGEVSASKARRVINSVSWCYELERRVSAPSAPTWGALALRGRGRGLERGRKWGPQGE